MSDKIAERPYGVHQSPEALIAAVQLQYLKQDRGQKDIADNLQVPTSVVLGILAETWGEPEWYTRPAPEQVKSEPRREYNVDHAHATLHCRVTGRDKAGWVKMANKAKRSLAQWVIATLNSGADFATKYNQDDGDYLHYAQKCIDEGQADYDKLEQMIGVQHKARQQLVSLRVDLNRLQFAIRQLIGEREMIATDSERLIRHCGVMSIELRDGADVVDRSTESFVALPDHLQEAINVVTDNLDAEEERDLIEEAELLEEIEARRKRSSELCGND